MFDEKYSYRDVSGIIDTNTMCPSKEFFYRIQKPESLNPSAFGCKIAFYSIENKLLYYRKRFFAHELHDIEELEDGLDESLIGEMSCIVETRTIEIVRWSSQGNVAYFREYFCWNERRIFESVILNLRDGYCFRINEIENNFQIASGLKMVDREFNEDEVIRALESIGLNREPLIKDKVVFGIFNLSFRRNSWHP